MTFKDILELSANGTLNTGDVDTFCIEKQITKEQFYDTCAAHLSQAYLNNRHGFACCDAAVNQLMGLAVYDVPAFFLAVYEAFDAGEYHHRNDPPERDPEDFYTKAMLRQALSTAPSKHADDG